jgi:hypothetical protein
MWIKLGDKYSEWSGTEDEFNASSLPKKGWVITTPIKEITFTEIIPQIITMRQCQLYLDNLPLINGRNVLDIIIEDVVPQLSRREKIEWDTSKDIWRSNPMVEQLRLMFGWTQEQTDNMFKDASLL